MKKPSTNADNGRKYRHRLAAEDSLLVLQQIRRAVKMAQQSAHNGGVAGGGNSFFPSFELSAILHRDLPCGNKVLNKMHLKEKKREKKMFHYIVFFVLM